MRKGLGAMSEEKRKQITSMGGKARHADRGIEAQKQGEDRRSQMGETRLADVLGALDE